MGLLSLGLVVEGNCFLVEELSLSQHNKATLIIQYKSILVNFLNKSPGVGLALFEPSLFKYRPCCGCVGVRS